MLGNVVYDGKSFMDFGIEGICKNPYDVPAPRLKTIHVDGKNGDLHYHYGDYENVNATYLCKVNGDFETIYREFKTWIYERRGYYRLEDDTYPEYYRMGMVKDVAKVAKYHDCFEITFDCKPQRYLKAGDDPIIIDISGGSGREVIYNSTSCDALPRIRSTMPGTLKVNDESVKINSVSGYIDIDSELMDCFRDNHNCNADVSLTDFPVLRPGENTITFDGSGSGTITITPRYYTL